MASDEAKLGESVAACVVDMRNVLAAEMERLSSEMVHRLLLQFAEAVAQTCSQLNGENLQLRKLLCSHGISLPNMAGQAVVTPDGHDIIIVANGNDTSAAEKLAEADLERFDPMSLAKKTSDTSLQNAESNELDSKVDQSADGRRDVTIDSDPERNDYINEEACMARRVSTGTASRRTSLLWLAKGSSQTVLAQTGWQGTINRIVMSNFFEGFFNFVIMFNCITMGVEAQQTIKSMGSSLDVTLNVSEHVMTALFCVELIARMEVFGWKEFVPFWGITKDAPWNVMDAFLVIITGVLFTWIIPFLALIFAFDTESNFVRTLQVLRAVRLLRLVRVVQRVPQFREAWLLLKGLTNSARILFWTCAVIMFITYIFAVFGMVLISKEIHEKRDRATDVQQIVLLDELLVYVGGLDVFMRTLIQLLTMDSWNDFMRKLSREIWWCWIFFYAYIAVAVFVLMNLVTAIIVENAVSNSKQDEDHRLAAREKVKMDELKQLEHLFDLMDADGSGTLSWVEFKAAFDDPEMTKKWKLLDFEPDECKELFGLLDDGDGEIETHEFFEGLAKMKGMAQSKDIFRLQKKIDTLVDKDTTTVSKMLAKSEANSPMRSISGNSQDKTINVSNECEDKVLQEKDQDVNAWIFKSVADNLYLFAQGKVRNGHTEQYKKAIANSKRGCPWVPASLAHTPGKGFRV